MPTTVRVDNEHTYLVIINGVEFICTEEEVREIFGEIPDHNSRFEFRKVDEGPRWEKPQYYWLTYGDFLGRYGKYDAYLCVSNGYNSIALIHERFLEHMPLPQYPHVVGNSNCKNWIEKPHSGELGVLFNKVYNEALAAKKLPEHPRYNRPQDAHTFLGWADCEKNDQIYDAWASDSKLFIVWGDVIHRQNIYPDNHCSMWRQAFDKAKEKGILKAAEKKKIQAEIDGLRRNIKVYMDKIDELERKYNEV